MQASPSSLGSRIFTHEPGSLGIIDSGLTSHDNEVAFQVLIQICLIGMSIKGIAIGDLVSNEEIRNDFNQHLMWLGYRVEFKPVSYDTLSKLVYYCSLNESGGIYLNRYHPFRLMEHMLESAVPHCYQSLYDDVNHLHQVFAIRRYREGAVVIYFKRINIIHN